MAGFQSELWHDFLGDILKIRFENFFELDFFSTTTEQMTQVFVVFFCFVLVFFLAKTEMRIALPPVQYKQKTEKTSEMRARDDHNKRYHIFNVKLKS